jgi:hypothetical protein
VLEGRVIRLRPVREADLDRLQCGFILEGTARGAFFNDGRNQDVLLFSLLRTDPRPWHTAKAADRG